MKIVSWLAEFIKILILLSGGNTWYFCLTGRVQAMGITGFVLFCSNYKDLEIKTWILQHRNCHFYLTAKYYCITDISYNSNHQQGGAPSPFDRNFGTKISARAMEWITVKLKEARGRGKGSGKGGHSLGMQAVRPWWKCCPVGEK